MVLDEATSALDTATERDTQTSLRELSRHHTTMIIAHRLSTIVDADQTIVLEAGRIEQGSHTDVLEDDRRYAEIAGKRSRQALPITTLSVSRI